MRLSGWERLWVVGAVLWLAGSGVALWPQQITIYTVDLDQKSYDVYSTHTPTEAETRFALKSDPFAQFMDDTPRLLVPPLAPEYDAQGKLVFPSSTRYYRATAAQLLSVWLLPPLAVYALGWSVGWVRRGFTAGGAP